MEVAKPADIPEGGMFGVAISGKAILISRIGGVLYAMDAVCSNYYGYLPRGELRDHAVVCPVHKAEYDVATGKVVKNVPLLMKLVGHREASDLRTYAVEVVGDRVMIEA